MSAMLKSRTLNVGESMAHWRAHPRATASSKLRVVLSSLRKVSIMMSFTAGVRQLPPSISTSSMALIDRPGIGGWRGEVHVVVNGSKGKGSRG